MNLGSLIEASTKELGLRFILIGILPSTVLFLLILALFWSGAPAEAPNFSLFLKKITGLEAKESVLLIIAILVFSLILQPLQLSFVRMLEGYWGGSRLGEALSKKGIALHKRRRQKLEAATRTSQDETTITQTERSHMAMATSRLLRFYPAEKRLLPTAFGNILRAAEDRAGKRYGLDAVLIWSRLYLLLPENLKSILADQRNQIDLAVRFCFVFLLTTVISTIFLFKHCWWLFVPASTLLLAWLSYRSAIAAALAYGEGIQAAFDLHRFDLLKALHLPLPSDIVSEKEINSKLSDFLRQDISVNFKYEHCFDEARNKNK